jgi:hypothetical protein
VILQMILKMMLKMILKMIPIDVTAGEATRR